MGRDGDSDDERGAIEQRSEPVDALRGCQFESLYANQKFPRNSAGYNGMVKESRRQSFRVRRMSENARPEARHGGYAGKGKALRGIPARREADNGCRCG